MIEPLIKNDDNQPTFSVCWKWEADSALKIIFSVF